MTTDEQDLHYRRILRDLELYGVPAELVEGRTIAELIELRDATARNLMGAPRRAA